MRFSLAAIRYSKDCPEAFGLSSRDVSVGSGVRGSLLANAVRISPQIFPQLADALDQAVGRIGASMRVEGFVVPGAEPNAHCVPIDRAGGVAVVLTSGLVELLETDELPFVIGHELGHYVFEHHSYPHVPGRGEADGDCEMLRVLSLRRAAEISADRMGFLCSSSLDHGLRGMLKVASGLSSRHLRFDLNAYLEQMRDLESLCGHDEAVYDTHPMFPLRARALLWFSMSEGYYHCAQRAGTAPLSAQRLDEQIDEDFAAVSGFGLDRLQSAALRSAKIWSVVRLATVDGRLSKREQALLGQVLGNDEAQRAIRFVSGCGNGAPEAIARKLDDALTEARSAPEKQRLELIEELERVASASGGSDEQRLQVLFDVARALELDRDVRIRPWAFA